MTKDRIFKEQIKELASLNDLSYTEAQSMVIQCKKLLNDLPIEEKNSLLKYLQESKEDMWFPKIIQEAVPDEKSIFIRYRDSTNKFLYGVLTDERRKRIIDISPLLFKNSEYSYYAEKNVERKPSYFVDSNTFRIVFSMFAEKFRRDQVYFVDEENYFTQVLKILEDVKNDDGKKKVLLGVMQPHNINNYSRDVVQNYNAKIVDLLKDEKIYVITNYDQLIDEEYCGRISLVKEDCKNIDIAYYPFDKVHGGSFHRKSKKIVIGHVDGKTYLADSRLILLEKSENCFLEKIHSVNKETNLFIVKDSHDFKQLTHSNKIQENKNCLIRIEQDIDVEELLLFLQQINVSFDSSQPFRQIIVEASNVDDIESHYLDSGMENMVECFSTYKDKYLVNKDGFVLSLYKKSM